MRRQAALVAVLGLSPLAALVTLSGCEEKRPAPPAQSGTGSTGASPDSAANHDDHDHSHGHSDGDTHGGAVVDLGTATIGAFQAAVTRDAAEIVAGKDAPVDVTVTPVAGGTARVAAVRLWIGTEDAAGTVKAKADIEDPKDPDRWHTHAEIPDPLPAGSKLWIEIEDDKGQKALGSFDLRA